jgi:hypothetical protein
MLRKRSPPITPEELRAAIARSGVPAYIIGGRARINPIKLSRLVRGHDPITPAIAARILLAAQQEEASDGR